MNGIVRKPSGYSADSLWDPLPTRSFRGEDFSIDRQLTLGVAPRLVLSWTAKQFRWNTGFALLGFHSTSGFSADRFPRDLSRHGQLIIDVCEDGEQEEQPAEGTHFYTFLLHRPGFLLENLSDPVRFSITVPTAKIAISRIRDKIEIENLLQHAELGKIDHGTKISGAKVRRIHSGKALARVERRSNRAALVHDIIDEELADIDVIRAALVARRRKIAVIESDPDLTEDERLSLIARIEAQLEPGSIAARRRMLESEE
jgi:hypothetical protein